MKSNWVFQLIIILFLPNISLCLNIDKNIHVIQQSKYGSLAWQTSFRKNNYLISIANDENNYYSDQRHFYIHNNLPNTRTWQVQQLQLNDANIKKQLFNIQGLTHNQNYAVMLASNYGDNKVFTLKSYDFIHWQGKEITPRMISNHENLAAILHDLTFIQQKNNFITLAEDSFLLSSNDGLQWQRHELPTHDCPDYCLFYPKKIFYINNKYVLIMQLVSTYIRSKILIYDSYDLNDWHLEKEFAANYIHAFTYKNSILLQLGQQNKVWQDDHIEHQIYQTINGKNWQKTYIRLPADWQIETVIPYEHNDFLIVKHSNNIRYDNDNSSTSTIYQYNNLYLTSFSENMNLYDLKPQYTNIGKLNFISQQGTSILASECISPPIIMFANKQDCHLLTIKL